VADIVAETGGVAERYHFLIRRLHSLSGVVPVGAFLCVHMLLNGSLIVGEVNSESAYQNAINLVHSLNRVGILKLVEVFGIFIPIAFHALVGILIWLTGQTNVLAHRYGGNVRYTLQRWTAWITLVFIFVHLYHVHHWIIPRQIAFDAHAATEFTAGVMTAWWAGPAYAIGLICAVFHFANGVWTFLIVWGITISPRAQRGAGYACAAIGIGLALLGLGAVCKLKTAEFPSQTPPAPTEVHTADAGGSIDQEFLWDRLFNPA